MYLTLPYLALLWSTLVYPTLPLLPHPIQPYPTLPTLSHPTLPYFNLQYLLYLLSIIVCCCLKLSLKTNQESLNIETRVKQIGV